MRFAFNVPLALCFEVEADDPISALEKAKAAVTFLDKSDYPVAQAPHLLFPVFQTAGVTFADMIDETETIVAACCNCNATTKTPGSWHDNTCPLFAS